MPVEYAAEHDKIAILEKQLMQFEYYAEDLESRKRRIENDLRMEIEIKAEDKASGLTNEKKRQLAYDELADCNEELQGLTEEVKIIRRECKKIRIEIGNEQRAFQLLIHKNE